MPLERGGKAGLFGGAGVGKTVVLTEKGNGVKKRGQEKVSRNGVKKRGQETGSKRRNGNGVRERGQACTIAGTGSG